MSQIRSGKVARVRSGNGRSPLSQHRRSPLRWSLGLLAALMPLAIAAPGMTQQVIDGLPPAPLPPAQPQAAPSAVPAVTVPPPSVQQAPAPSSYVVVVDGNSPLLLSQVQQIEPGASLVPVDNQELIQAGAFSTEAEAVEQVRQLAGRGIGARIVATTPVAQPQAVAAEPVGQVEQVDGFPLPDLPPAPIPREIQFESDPPEFDELEPSPSLLDEDVDDGFGDDPERAYYLVVPADDSELPDISEQIIRLSYGFRMSRLVTERDSRLGSHVLVGPFSGRGAAERWNDYFRDFGINSRVYFER
ncbi:MAG: SPOR domain-containing protein [Cyanobacteria bacterium J06638_20]